MSNHAAYTSEANTRAHSDRVLRIAVGAVALILGLLFLAGGIYGSRVVSQTQLGEVAYDEAVDWAEDLGLLDENAELIGELTGLSEAETAQVTFAMQLGRHRSALLFAGVLLLVVGLIVLITLLPDRVSDVIFDTSIYIFFGLFTILCVFPFYYLFINTISSNDAVAGGLVNFYPIGVHVQNYVALKDVSDLGSSVIVTVLRTIIGTALMVIVSAWAGYLVTKQKMWKRSFMYRALVITMYFNAGLIPWYMNMLMLGLTNNFLAYILPGMIAPYNIILVKTYIESIPASLEESAVIDGANTPTVFTKIVLPLSVPILATISIFGAVGNWNSFQDSLLLMSSRPEMYTLQHRLYVYLNQSSNLAALVSGSGSLSTQAAQNMLNTRVIKYTVSMVSIVPILLVYPFMQRFFVKGIMLGAVKG